ncbi:MAG: gluconate 2-dehydrogenase subunit 3 family protein [Rhodospirillales bacterium]|nr:gluconate 2-dehydrogenase subunit 3 family protein [Rhodospirillales bacterium]
MDDHTTKTLADMARRLYPHDSLAHAHYARVVEIIAGELAPDREALLRAGVTALDGVFDRPFVDLSEEAQVEALKKVEGSPFFEDMRAATVRHLYNNPDVWRHFGYQGPSAHLGGYIKPGSDDIPWIPDDGLTDE